MSRYEDDDDDDFDDEEDEEDEERLQLAPTDEEPLGVEEARPDDDFPDLEQAAFDAGVNAMTEANFDNLRAAFRKWGIENGFVKDGAPATTAEEE